MGTGDTSAGAEGEPAAAAIRRGDEEAFVVLAGRYRRELHVHCYRFVGSLEDAEDLVQETLLRAWRARETFEGRSSLRAWLYRIATNACLDLLDRRPRRALPPDVAKASNPAQEPPGASDIPWLDPYPGRLLESLASDEEAPETIAIRRETIELAFLATIQHLPRRRRAVLILRDVLGWSAKDSAETLGLSVASVNSTLQRARRGLREHLPAQRLDWTATGTPCPDNVALLRRYMDAHERGDIDGLARLLREDARISAPPLPLWYEGRDAIVTASRRLAAADRFRYLATGSNLQLAAASYVLGDADSIYRPMGIDVLRIEDGLV